MDVEQPPTLRKMTDIELQAVLRDVKGQLKVVLDELKRRNTEIVQRMTPPLDVRRDGENRG